MDSDGRDEERGEDLRGIKSSFSITLIRTTRRRIPAISSSNQGTEKGDVIAAGDDEERGSEFIEGKRAALAILKKKVKPPFSTPLI